MSIGNKKDILLLLLYSSGRTDEPNEPICGRTRIVKMIYLFKKEVLEHFKKGTKITEENFYNFFPWNFGPFSVDVYDDIAFFILYGFIEEIDCLDEPSLPESASELEEWQEQTGLASEEERYNEYREAKYTLTEKGINFVEKELWGELNRNQKALLKHFKAKMTDAPLRAILRYVYATYPESTTKSKITDDIF